MLALSAAIGVVIGLSLGALGGGGSILTVPALVYVLGQDPHAATTGSLIIVGITSLAGMAAHARERRVRVGAGITFGVLGIAGAYVGSRLAASVDPDVLLTAFAGLMVVAAAMMTLRRRKAERAAVAAAAAVGGPGAQARASAADPPAVGSTGDAGTGDAVTDDAVTDDARPVARALKVVAAASGVGLVTGFFGVGGGFVVVPALVLALGFSMPTAVGTSLLVIAINSASALVARLGNGIELDWAVIGTFTAAAIVGSLLGSRVASRVNPAKLSVAFTWLLVLVAAYTAGRSIPHL